MAGTERYDSSVVETTTLRPLIDIIPILPESVVEELDLAKSSRAIQNSVRESNWGKVGAGRMMFEVRNPFALQSSRGGVIDIYDFDDCLMSATGWHRNEYSLLEGSPILQAQGINITEQDARQIYELSKINVFGLAEKEKRYTPKLNLILLSRLADAKRQAFLSGQDDERSWEEMLSWNEVIREQVQLWGERALNGYSINPTIQGIFMENSPSKYLYGDFIDDILGQTGGKDMRIIASRGKIEGPLGQVYKVHSSGLMRKRARFGQGIDLAVYSNDIKAEALLSIMGMVPDIDQRLIRIYDDNPSEIIPYLETAKNLGVRNIDIVHVVHPDAKRKDLRVEADPSVSYKRGDTIYHHYSQLSVR